MFATQPPLDTKSPVGNGISKPQYKDGVAEIISTKSAPTNQGTDINGTYDHTNFSAKFKNPQVKQSVPEAGQGQYM